MLASEYLSKGRRHKQHPINDHTMRPARRPARSYTEYGHDSPVAQALKRRQKVTDEMIFEELPKHSVSLFRYVERMLRGQFRQTGTPKITHSYEAAFRAKIMGEPYKGIDALLLHDVVEETAGSVSEIVQGFEQILSELKSAYSRFLPEKGALKASEAVLTQLIRLTNLHKLIIGSSVKTHLDRSPVNDTPPLSQEEFSEELLRRLEEMPNILGAVYGRALDQLNKDSGGLVSKLLMQEIKPYIDHVLLIPRKIKHERFSLAYQCGIMPERVFDEELYDVANCARIFKACSIDYKLNHEPYDFTSTARLKAWDLIDNLRKVNMQNPHALDRMLLKVRIYYAHAAAFLRCAKDAGIESSPYVKSFRATRQVLQDEVVNKLCELLKAYCGQSDDEYGPIIEWISCFALPQHAALMGWERRNYIWNEISSDEADELEVHNVIRYNELNNELTGFKIPLRESRRKLNRVLSWEQTIKKQVDKSRLDLIETNEAVFGRNGEIRREYADNIP